MVRLTIFSLALFSSLVSFGQFSTQNTWSYSIYLGGSNMMSDLGGSDYANTSTFRDIDLQASRLALGLGLQYNVKALSFGLSVKGTQLVGDDAYTSLPGRADRNLSVRTDLLEAAFTFEVMPFQSTPVLNRMYFGTGIGGSYFQPKAEFNDEWYKLRPLGTEGQNYLADAQPYSSMTVVIPFTVGYKIPVGSYSTLNIDLGLRKTFTDYLDDVSTVYANSTAIAEAGGPIAATLADRSATGFAEGSQRGNSESNDSYFFIGLKFQRVIGANKMTSCTNFDDPNRKVRKRRKTKANRFYSY